MSRVWFFLSFPSLSSLLLLRLSCPLLRPALTLIVPHLFSLHHDFLFYFTLLFFQLLCQIIGGFPAHWMTPSVCAFSVICNFVKSCIVKVMPGASYLFSAQSSCGPCVLVLSLRTESSLPAEDSTRLSSPAHCLNCCCCTQGIRRHSFSWILIQLCTSQIRLPTLHFLINYFSNKFALTCLRSWVLIILVTNRFWIMCMIHIVTSVFSAAWY